MLSINWAQNLWKNELAEPADISVPSLVAYYRCNINDLNNALGTSFVLNNQQGLNYLELINGQDTTTLIDDQAANVYKYLYLVSYYARQIRNLLGVGGVSMVSSVSSDGGNVRFVERHNLARVYIDLKKQTEDILKNLVNKYKMQNQTAQDVQGDDQFVVPGSDLGNNGVLYQSDIY